MAFPTIPTVAAGRVLSNVQADTTATRTFPSLTGLTKNAGDLLIAICVAYQTSTGTDAAFSGWTGGFTEFHDSATSTTMAIGCAYKWSTGSETGTIAVTQAGTITGHAGMFLLSIPGAHATTPPEAGGRASNVNSNADAGSLDPAGWGTEDTLWIAVAGVGETNAGGSFQGVIGADPSGWSGGVDGTISADVVGGVNGAVSFLQSAAASVDPPAFNTDVSNSRWGAITIGVRPAPATQLGAVVSPFTFERVINGVRTVFGSVVSPFTFERVTAGAVPAAFPTTGVLSNFTGTDEDPISEGGNWVASGIRTTTNRGRRVGNQFARAAVDTTGFDGVWAGVSAADLESYVTYSVLSGGTARPSIYARIQNEGTTSVVAYNFGYVQAAGTWRFFRLSNTTFTQIGGDHAGPDPSAGDSFGISVIGTTLEGWHKPAAGSWTSLGTETDSNITGAGKVGLSTGNNTSIRLDDFGGGEATAGPPTHFGAATQAFTFERVTAAKVTAKSAVAAPSTFERVSAAKVTAKGAVASPFTFGRVVNGVRTRLGQVALPVTFERVVAGRVTAKGAIVLPLNWNFTTSATAGGGGAVSQAFTFGRVTAGKVHAKAATTQAFAFERLVAGRLTAKSSAALPITFGEAVSAKVTAKGAIVSPVTFERLAAAKVTAKGAVGLPILWDITTAGGGAGTGSVSLAATWGTLAAGKVTAKGAVALPVTFERSTNGTRTTFGGVALPLTFSAASLGKVHAYGDVALPIVFGLATTGFTGALGVPVFTPRTRATIATGSTTTSGVSGRTGATVTSGQTSA